MHNIDFEFVSKLFPFVGLDLTEIERIFSKIEFTIRDYSKGDSVFSPSEERREIGFLISGECRITRYRSCGEEIPLNSISAGQSFGILRALDPEGEFPTGIVAVKPSKIMFIGGNDFKELTQNNVRVASNVIDFLVTKINFLNKKIETFSGSNTSEKLASYLLSKQERFGNSFSLPRTKISSEINVGRASLYRDLNSFCERGLIKIDGKKIIIICPEGLERIIK